MPPPSQDFLKSYQARRMQAEYARSSTTAICEFAQAYREGRQWYWFDRNQGIVWDDPEIRAGAVINLTKFCLDGMASQMTAPILLPCVESMPYTSELASLSRIKEAVARKVYKDNGGNACKDRLGQSLCTYGLVFGRPHFDEYMKDTILLNRQELEQVDRMRNEEFRGRGPLEVTQYAPEKYAATMRMGGVRWEWMAPNRVFVPDGTETLDECDWFMVSTFAPVEVLRKRVAALAPDADVGLIQPVYVLNKGFGTVSMTNGASTIPLTTGWSFDQQYNSQQSKSSIPVQAETGFLQEYWHREGGEWVCDYFTGAGMGQWVARVEGYADHGIVDIRLERREQFFWPIPPIMDGWQIQNSINKMQTQRIFIYKSMPGDVVMMPAGAEMGPLSTQKSVYMCKYEGNQKPELLQFSNAGIRYLAEEEAHLFSRMMLIYRVSQVQMGSIPDRASANALAQANEINASALRYPFENIKNGLARMIENSIDVLKNAGDLTTYPRLVAATNSLGAGVVQEWSQHNLTGLTSVVMEQRVALPDSYEERFDVAVKLGIDVFAPENEQTLRNLNAYVTGEWGPTFQARAKELASLTAEMENKAFAGGEVQFTEVQEAVPGDGGRPEMVRAYRLVNARTGEFVFQEGQMNDIHIDHHQKLIQDPFVPEPVKAMVRFHITEEHGKDEARMAQAAMQEQIDTAARMSAAQATGPILTGAVTGEIKGSPNSQGSQGAKGGRPRG